MTDLTDDLGFLLSRASGLVIQATNTALADQGLRVRSYSVLVLACDRPEGRSQRDLAALLGLDPSQVVALVDELEAAGLVERRPSPADRRTRLIAATSKGRRVRRVAAGRVSVGQQDTIGALDDTERANLRALLLRMVGDAVDGRASA